MPRCKLEKTLHANGSCASLATFLPNSVPYVGSVSSGLMLSLG
uniref:Protein tesmin/TSO1-like CXC 3 n=1 Tax=Rhizophora mucronata TaxID=61149 RepID=A0A2P2PWV3_RHIMU